MIFAESDFSSSRISNSNDGFAPIVKLEAPSSDNCFKFASSSLILRRSVLSDVTTLSFVATIAVSKSDDTWFMMVTTLRARVLFLLIEAS